MRRLAMRYLVPAGIAVVFAAGQAVAGEGEQTDIPVPRVMIYAGQTVDASKLRPRRVPVRYLQTVDVVTRARDAEGKVAKTTLVPSRPIPLSQLRAPDVIEASKPVRMIFRTGGLLIEGEAVPLQAAAAGERIRARNLHTGIVVFGTAMEDGTLLVTGR